MTVLTERIHNGEWLLHEGDGQISREAVTVTVASQVLMPTGTVLGKITATGKYIPSLNAAADGSQTAVAILLNDIPPRTAGDVKAAIIARLAEVWGSQLNAGVALESTVVTELLAQNIIVR